jgi:hypothetical protein
VDDACLDSRDQEEVQKVSTLRSRFGSVSARSSPTESTFSTRGVDRNHLCNSREHDAYTSLCGVQVDSAAYYNTAQVQTIQFSPPTTPKPSENLQLERDL